ncbi:MAG: hypothetical protein U0163_00275 [Gemmatimonadaceae bacterium]
MRMASADEGRLGATAVAERVRRLAARSVAGAAGETDAEVSEADDSPDDCRAVGAAGDEGRCGCRGLGRGERREAGRQGHRRELNASRCDGRSSTAPLPDDEGGK